VFFTFPEDTRWNAERQAVEFGSRSASTAAWSRSHGGSFSAYSVSRPPPGRAWRSTTLHPVRAYGRADAASAPVDQEPILGGDLQIVRPPETRVL
jgi:hypothetical protein